MKVQVQQVGPSFRGMSQAELKAGRLLRGPDGHDGGEGGNNEGENSGPSGDADDSENNASNAFDGEAFWDSPDDENDGPPSGGSDGQKPESSGQLHPLVGELNNSLSGMRFDSLLTPDLMEKMGEGDFGGFNEGMAQFGQGVARQTLGMAVNVMKAMEQNIMERVESKISGSIQNDKSYSALESAIPAASNPKTAPLVKQIYAQALKQSRGNVKSAIEQTKSVMQIQAEVFGGDLNLQVAPRNSRDAGPPKVTNWLEELNATQ